jgi:hypothetical protein
MKHFPIKKRKDKKPVFIVDHRGSLPKPELPKKVLFKIHKPEVYVEFVFKD